MVVIQLWYCEVRRGGQVERPAAEGPRGGGHEAAALRFSSIVTIIIISIIISSSKDLVHFNSSLLKVLLTWLLL